jgi:DtxR family Mn-dependent transcriptional regulator
MAKTENRSNVTKKERDCLLKAMEISDDSFPVRLCEIAKALGIRPPSALEIVNRLSAKGMVKTKAGMIFLTKSGRDEYERIKLSHRALEALLVQGGISAEKACRDIELFDYFLDRKTTLAILKTIGNPSSCPHGHPIKAGGQ